MVFTPIKRIAQVYAEYREACERFGYTASRYQLSVNLPILCRRDRRQGEKASRASTPCGSISVGPADAAAVLAAAGLYEASRRCAGY